MKRVVEDRAFGWRIRCIRDSASADTTICAHVYLLTNAFQWIGRWANHLGARRTRVVRMAHVMAAAAGCGSRQQHVVEA
eukprot:COSAG05_NODE_4025_length_1712_cov_2.835090_3_plen_79_part_00